MDQVLIKYLIKRIEDIDSKVDTLLKFKWQVIGASAVLSLIITVLFQIGIALLERS